MKQINWLIFSLFLVLVMPHHSQSTMGMVRLDSTFKGEPMALHVNVVNPLEHDMEDVTVSIWAPEMDDFYYKTKGFDVAKRENTGRFVFPGFETAESDMLVRIMVENDDGKTIKWRHLMDYD